MFHRSGLISPAWEEVTLEESQSCDRLSNKAFPQVWILWNRLPLASNPPNPSLLTNGIARCPRWGCSGYKTVQRTVPSPLPATLYRDWADLTITQRLSPPSDEAIFHKKVKHRNVLFLTNNKLTRICFQTLSELVFICFRMKYLPATFTDTPNLPLLWQIPIRILFDLCCSFFRLAALSPFHSSPRKILLSWVSKKLLRIFFFFFWGIFTGPLPSGKKYKAPQRK